MSDLATNGYESRVVSLAGVDVRVSSYTLGSRFSCRVDNLDPGGNIARGSGPTRADAESTAMEAARLALELRSASANMRAVVDAMNKKNGSKTGTR